MEYNMSTQYKSQWEITGYFISTLINMGFVNEE